jgi:hypothetical protein
MAVALLAGSGEAPAATPASIAVIVNPAVPTGTMGSGELASIFTRAKRTWRDGSPIRPLNLQPGTRERAEFDRAVLDMSPEASAKFWVDKQVRGEDAAPKAVAQADIVVSLVATMTGAVGYVPEDKVDARVRVIARIRGGSLVAP